MRVQLGFADHSLVSVDGVLDAVLWRAGLERKQADDRVAASAGPIDARIRHELDSLADAEFVL